MKKIEQVFAEISEQYGQSTAFAAVLTSRMMAYVNLSRSCAVSDKKDDITNAGMLVLTSSINEMRGMGMITIEDPEDFLALSVLMSDAAAAEMGEPDQSAMH